MEIRIDFIEDVDLASIPQRQQMKEKIKEFLAATGRLQALSVWDYCEVTFKDSKALLAALPLEMTFEQEGIQPFLTFGAIKAKLLLSMNYESNIYIKDHL